MADVPDGARGADARAGPPLPPVRARDDPLRRRALHDRGRPPLQGHRPAARRDPVYSRRRIHDSRHGDLPLAPLPREPGPKPGRLPQPQALVRQRGDTTHRPARGAGVFSNVVGRVQLVCGVGSPSGGAGPSGSRWRAGEPPRAAARRRPGRRRGPGTARRSRTTRRAGRPPRGPRRCRPRWR